jgi:hypothetical protein
LTTLRGEVFVFHTRWQAFCKLGLSGHPQKRLRKEATLKARLLWLAGTLIVSAVAFAGCAKSTVPVKGTVLMDDKPITLQKNETLQLYFMWTNAEGRKCLASTTAKADATFDVPGPQNQGLPPGEYKVALVLHTVKPNEEDPTLLERRDRLEGEFSQEKTPLKFSVQQGIEAVTIDVGKKTVTVK